MSTVSEPQCEKEDLSLSPSPTSAGIKVQNSPLLHSPVSLSANARKIPRSHGSGESFISSGCH